MLRPTPQQKQVARQSQRRWDRAGDAIAVATAGTALSAAGQPVFAEEILKIGAFLFIIVKGMAAEKGRMADDPARDDFESATYPARRDLDLSVFGEGPITNPARTLAHLVLDSTAYLRAMVRAIERAQGAELDDRPRLAEARAEEARRYAREAAARLADLAPAADGLALAFETFGPTEQAPPPSEAISGRPISIRLDEALPEASLVLLFRAGIRIEEIRKAVTGTLPHDLGQHLGRLIRRAARSTRVLSAQLALGELAL